MWSHLGINCSREHMFKRNGLKIRKRCVCLSVIFFCHLKDLKFCPNAMMTSRFYDMTNENGIFDKIEPCGTCNVKLNQTY